MYSNTNYPAGKALALADNLPVHSAKWLEHFREDASQSD